MYNKQTINNESFIDFDIDDFTQKLMTMNNIIKKIFNKITFDELDCKVFGTIENMDR